MTAGNELTISSSPFMYTGNYHVRNSAQNDDFIRSERCGDLLLLGIADGQSGKKHSRLGAEQALEECFSFFCKVNIERIKDLLYQKELARELMLTISRRLGEAASMLSADVTELSSTVMVLAINESGAYCSLNLGDGFILGIDTQNNISVLSHGENGLSGNATWLTTSKDACVHVRFSYGSIGHYKRLVLSSDGASCLYRNKSIAYAARRILTANDREKVLEYISRKRHLDDASGYVLDIIR